MNHQTPQIRSPWLRRIMAVAPEYVLLSTFERTHKPQLAERRVDFNSFR